MKNLTCRIIILAIAIITALLPAIHVSAISEEDFDFMNINNIFYYNPDGCNTTSSALHLQGDSVAEVVWNYLVDHGVTSAEVIAGVLGNFQIESGMDPYQLGNHSSNYAGLVQYMHGDELRAYVDEQVPEGKSYWHQSYSSSGIPKDVMLKAAYAEMEFMFEKNSTLMSSTKPFLNELDIVSSRSGEAGARAYSDLWLVQVERAVNGSDPIEDPGVRELAHRMGGDKYQGASLRRTSAVEYYNKFKNNDIKTIADHSNGDVSENVGGNTLIIGDSITEGSRSVILSKLTGLDNSHINARVSRPWSEGVSELRTALADTSFDPSIIVFALGTNNPGSITKQDISEVLGLAGDRQVVFVTNYGNNGFEAGYANNNKLFEEAAKENENVSIADWATEVAKDTTKYLATDGVHPTAEGAELFASLLTDSANTAAGNAKTALSDPCKNRIPGSGNGDINQTAIDLAWPEHGHGLTPTEAYRHALQEIGLSTYGDYYASIGASCDAFVATVMRYSGVDPNFVCCGVSNSGATWNYVTNSGKFVEVPNKLGELKPGDIRLSNGHIELYVEVNGEPKIASASYGDRTGEIGNFYENSGTFKAYRFKG